MTTTTNTKPEIKFPVCSELSATQRRWLDSHGIRYTDHVPGFSFIGFLFTVGAYGVEQTSVTEGWSIDTRDSDPDSDGTRSPIWGLSLRDALALALKMDAATKHARTQRERIAIEREIVAEYRAARKAA